MNELQTLAELQKLCEHIEKNNWEHLYAEPLKQKLTELRKRKPLSPLLTRKILLIETILTELL